ncbi:MAG: acyl-CoA desaturase [Bacteroidia bacterium]|nr:acyl-CoA desaturase [Bacteroidia bacterium]
MKPKIKFTNKDKTQFFNVLKQRVDHYFVEKNISQHANWKMVVKSIFMLALYYVPYSFIISGNTAGWSFWLCWVLIGLGLAGIGMGIMHDANHGAYSSKNWVNRMMGHTVSLVGADLNNWKTQHNILHHTYTNIYDHDEDIDDKVGMRFSPSGKHQKIQRFQVFYAFFFYSLMTLYWTTSKDFMQFARYVREGHNKDIKRDRIKKFIAMIFFKVLYYSYMLVLPLLILDNPWYQIVLGFLLMHAVAGIVLSVTFQLAHVVEGTTFPVPDDKGNIENEWAIHQLNTTADFAAKNPIVTFYVGGLNYQAIHHLFPRICHVHYPDIAPIVEQTAKEFGIRYIYFPTAMEAFMSHLRMLKKLGRNEIRHLAAEMG